MDGIALRVIPSTLINEFAVKFFPTGDIFASVDERKDGAGDDGNVGASDDFEQAESVKDFFIAPGVTGEDGDAEDFGVWRVDEGEDGLHVGAAGACGVLVDDDFAFGLRGESGGQESCEQRADEEFGK